LAAKPPKSIGLSATSPSLTQQPLTTSGMTELPFLTTEPQIVKYLSTARQAVKENGFVTIGTFSTEGPQKCSGLNIKQYSEETLTAELENGFKKIKCITEDHTTPFNTKQNFLFCSFKRTEPFYNYLLT
jgi:hypothetical protein